MVDLNLEPTSAIVGQVELPDDTGASSGVLAPLVSVEATQRCSNALCQYQRSTQSNPFRLESAFAGSSYQIAVSEIGGEGRRLSIPETFPNGSPATPLHLVLPAFGSVHVTSCRRCDSRSLRSPSPTPQDR